MIQHLHPTSVAEIHANAAAVRKRLFAPQREPRKTEEAKPRPDPCPSAVASPELVVRRVIDLAKQGKIQADIAKSVGLDSKKVRRILEGAGVVAESRPLGKDRTLAIQALFERGLSQRSIAAILRIDRNAVGSIIKRQGFTR